MFHRTEDSFVDLQSQDLFGKEQVEKLLKRFKSLDKSGLQELSQEMEGLERGNWLHSQNYKQIQLLTEL